jgi:selenocysteine lyase/cysteine desulfurase
MVVRRALAERLPNQGHYFNAGYPSKRLVPAGPDHAQIAACAGMADYVDALHDHHFGAEADAGVRGARVRGLMAEQERRLIAPLMDWLRGRNDLRLIGPDRAEARVPTVAIDAGRPAEPLAAALAGHGIAAGGGHFYAVRLLEGLGIDPDRGVLRVSFVHYTHPDEVERLIGALDDVLARQAA